MKKKIKCLLINCEPGHIINNLCNPIISDLCSYTLIPTITYLFLEGQKHDAGMLADSQLLHDLHQFAYNPAGQAVCVYGDPAYPIRVPIQGPFRYGVLSSNNIEMSAVRGSVEWLFRDVIN